MNRARATIEARNPAVNRGSMSGRSRHPSAGSTSRSPTSSIRTCGGASASMCSARHSATRTAVLSGSSACSSATMLPLSHDRSSDRPKLGAFQWLNSRFSTNTTITVDVIDEPKMIWKSLGNFS